MARISKAPEERRQELVDAAMGLFWQQGYERTTVSDIVKRVGVAQGLFYYYFQSKQDIFMAAIDQFIRAQVQEFALLLREASEMPVFHMHNVVWALTDLLRKVDQAGLRVENGGLSLEAQVHAHRHVAEQLEPILTQILTDGAAQGVLDVPNPKHTARFILAGFVGVESRPDAPQADEMVELVLRMVERLLCLPAGGLERQA